MLFVPFVTEPLFELSFQLVHRHGVDVTKGIGFSCPLLLRDLPKQALEKPLDVLGAAECLVTRTLALCAGTLSSDADKAPLSFSSPSFRALILSARLITWALMPTK